jgi:hypothetical protein
MRHLGLTVMAMSGIFMAGSTANAGSTFNVIQQFEGGIGGYTTPQPVPLFSQGSAADVSGAVGMNGSSEMITELLNGYYGVYSSSGVPVTQETAGVFWANALGATTLSSTFGTASVSFDAPHILYDPTSQRWFASTQAVGSSTSLLLAVSNTSNPGGTWSGFVLPTDGSSTDNFDTLAVNGQNVYLNTQALGEDFIAIPKAAVTAAVPTVSGYRIFAGISATGGYVVQPVQETGSSSATEYYYSGDSANQLNRSVMTGTSLYNYQLSQGPGSVTAFTTAKAASTVSAISQPGTTAGTIAGGDSRLSSNVYMVNGLVWGTQVVANTAFPTLNGIRYFAINPKTNRLVVQGILSDSTGAISYDYPSIAVSATGNVVLDFVGGSATQNLSTYVATGTFNGSDLSLNLSAAQVLNTAPGTYGKGASWGQYSSIVADPNNPNDFWIFQELPDGTNPNQWDTWITQIDPPVSGTLTATEVPEPDAMALLMCGAAPLLLTLRRRRKVS